MRKLNIIIFCAFLFCGYTVSADDSTASCAQLTAKLAQYDKDIKLARKYIEVAGKKQA